MRLKSELHAIIGTCAAVAFLVIGVAAWWEVRRVHLLEVQARGTAMALHLSRACAVAFHGPNESADLKYLLSSSKDDEEHRVVSAVVYDVDGARKAHVGATSREPGRPEEDPFLQEVLGLPPAEADRVLVQRGEVQDRFGPRGEEIFEFATPIVDRAGNPQGVLVLALAREPVAYTFVRTVAFMVAVAALFVGLLWLILFKMLTGRILAPILRLSQGIERVRAGDLTARVEIPRQDEIGTLVHSFNDLIGILVERDSLQARLEEANRLAEAHARLHEAHRQLKQAQEQLILNEKHASLGRLVHGLNHELNNPLSAARNMIPPLEGAIRNLREELLRKRAALLEEASGAASGGEGEGAAAQEGEAAAAADGEPASGGDELDPEIAEDLADVESAVEVISRSVGRAINLVKDLGAFSKLGTADLEEVSLEALVQDAIAACAAELGDGRVEVEVDVPETAEGPLRLLAFPNLLTQVFVNLITNAAQAMDGGPGKVRIGAQLVGDGRVRVDVEDNGPGIAKEHLPKIFEPFFTTKEQGKGTGLGLSICLGFVQKHGGTIEARRRRKGAHFVIELPLEPVVEELDPWASTQIFDPTASGSRVTAASARLSGGT